MKRNLLGFKSSFQNSFLLNCNNPLLKLKHVCTLHFFAQFAVIHSPLSYLFFLPELTCYFSNHQAASSKVIIYSLFVYPCLNIVISHRIVHFDYQVSSAQPYYHIYNFFLQFFQVQGKVTVTRSISILFLVPKYQRLISVRLSTNSSSFIRTLLHRPFSLLRHLT